MSEHIHKIEIARRQLDVALELFFSDHDYLAVVTLAGAAEEILGSILKRNGKTAMIDEIVHFEKHIKDDRKVCDIKKEANTARNALKHANDDSEDKIKIAINGETHSMLSRAVLNYIALTNDYTLNICKYFDYIHRTENK